MSIDINGLNNPHATGVSENSTVSPARNEATETREENASPPAGDTVNLTDAAKQLSQLESHLKTVPVVDTQRVQETRQTITDGGYEVNAGNVASKLSQFEAYLPHR